MEVINLLRLDKENRHKEGKTFFFEELSPRMIDVADLFYVGYKRRNTLPDNHDPTRRFTRLNLYIQTAQLNAKSLLKNSVFTFENYIVAGGWFTKKTGSDIDIFIYKDHDETLGLLFFAMFYYILILLFSHSFLSSCI